MSTSAPSPRKSPASGAGDVRSDEGLWGLVLWSGTAWFSDWFYRRLQWSVSVKHKRLDVLQPHLTEGSWEALLLAIRAHLEQGLPLVGSSRSGCRTAAAKSGRSQAQSSTMSAVSRCISPGACSSSNRADHDSPRGIYDSSPAGDAGESLLTPATLPASRPVNQFTAYCTN